MCIKSNKIIKINGSLFITKNGLTRIKKRLETIKFRQFIFSVGYGFGTNKEMEKYSGPKSAVGPPDQGGLRAPPHEMVILPQPHKIHQKIEVNYI